MNANNTVYERFDGCYGIVTGNCRSGAYLTLDNGQEAFAYKFASLRPDTKVLCTVLKMPTEEKRMLVSIDSVSRDFPCGMNEGTNDRPPEKGNRQSC